MAPVVDRVAQLLRPLRHGLGDRRAADGRGTDATSAWILL